MSAVGRSLLAPWLVGQGDAGGVRGVVVQVHIIRDARVRPGGEGVLEMPGEILFIASADGVTAQGAAALEDCWRWFIDRGIWRYCESGGEPITTNYIRASLDGDAARVRTEPGLVTVWCDPSHFTRGSVNGLRAAARASVRRGWRYYSMAESETQAS